MSSQFIGHLKEKWDSLSWFMMVWVLVFYDEDT